MTRAEKDAAIGDLSSRIFMAMLEDIAMDAALQVHKEERLSRRVCDVCGTRCRQLKSNFAPESCSYDTIHNSTPSSSKAGAVSPRAAITAGSQLLASSSGPSGPSKLDVNVNLDCVNCQRPIASNRYAQHLATCLGIGVGVRRTVQRTVVTKTKMSASGRSGSPYIEDALEDVKSSGKSKAKPKMKAQDDEMSATQRRMPSSQGSPSKKQKKGQGPTLLAQSTTGTGPPRLPGSQHRLGLPGSNPKTPSKLRSTPTPSVASLVSKNSRTPSTTTSDSSDSDGDSAAEAESRSSVSGLSPSLPAAESIGREQPLVRGRPGSFANGPGGSGGNSSGKAKKVIGTGPPAKKPPPPPVPRLSSSKAVSQPPVRRPESNYLIDIEGEETGSDTD